MREPPLWVLACVSMSLAACSGDAVELGNGGDDDVQSESPQNLRPARGISIAEIEVNQGTRVAIGQGGDWIAGEDRELALIGSRDTLLRVHFTVDPGWIPREIEARLLLEFADGSSQTVSSTLFVEANSVPDPLDGGFWFQLLTDAGQTQPDTKYRVELWETQDVGAELPEQVWANPVDGPQPIGFEPFALEMKVVFVPIHYLPLDKTPQLDDPTVALLIDNLYEQNPTNLILYDIREPLEYTDLIDDLASVLPLLSQAKVSDGADDNTYYHALLDVGGPTLAGRRGIANIVGPDPGEGASRVAATVFWAGDPSLAAETFTHEVGHNQGLSHVMCPRTEADGLEPDYPHLYGWIGNWGAGVHSLKVAAPDEAFDYMSYCIPSWVSDWTWLATQTRIATLTAWDYQANRGAEDERTLLIGALHPDGRAHWWTAPGKIDPERVKGSERVTFVTDEGEVVERWAQVDRLSEGETRWVKVELPTGLDRITAIGHRHGEQTSEVPLAAIVNESTIAPWTAALRTF